MTAVIPSYTLTRRHDNIILETGVKGYLNALKNIEKYPNVDVIIHLDGTDWREEKAKEPAYDITQGGWAFL